MNARNNNSLFDNFKRQFEGAGQDDGAVVEAAEKKGSFLDFINPTEVVMLPSKGLYYPVGHPLHMQESIEIRQMTAKEEDILTNKSFIKKGIVFEKLIESLMIDKRVKHDDLYIGDKNAVLIVARISSYGDRYEFKTMCPSCGNKHNDSVDLTSCLNYSLDNVDTDNEKYNKYMYERLPSGNLLIKLPKTEWTVECKLLNGHDEKYLAQLAESKQKFSKNSETTFTELLSLIIQKIENEDDRNVINKAIMMMPAADALYLKRAFELLSPNVKLNFEFDCSSCGHSQEMEVPITQDFFWPEQ